MKHTHSDQGVKQQLQWQNWSPLSCGNHCRRCQMTKFSKLLSSEHSPAATACKARGLRSQTPEVMWFDMIYIYITIFSPTKMGLNPIVMCFLWCLILICWLNPQFWRWNNMHWICPNMEGTHFRSCCFNTGKSLSLGWPFSRKQPSEYYTTLTLKFAETLKCTCLSSPQRHHSRSNKFTVDVINNQYN